MKDPLLARLINDTVPKINQRVAEGLAVKDSKLAIEYIDARLKTLAETFPKGFLYHGCRTATDKEQYQHLTKSSNVSGKNNKPINRSEYEIARTDLYMVIFQFSIHGEMINYPIYLPHVNDDCTIYLSGTCWHIAPVMADRVISIDDKSIFVQLERTKMNFYRQSHSYTVERQDNVGRYQHRREDIQVPWAYVHHLSQRAPKKDHTTLAHYLFAKYGLRKTFEMFCGFVPEVGDDSMITVDSHPLDKWVICSPCPQGRRPVIHQEVVRFAIPIEHYNPMTQSLIAGFYYTSDRFPGRMRYSFVDENNLWMRLLGALIYGPGQNEGHLQIKMMGHFQSLDEYIDKIMIDKFEQINIKIDNLYQLFAIIIANINNWLVMDNDESITMYGKELTVLRFLISPILSSINNFYFALKNLDPNHLTKDQVEKLLKSRIKARKPMFDAPKNLNIFSTMSYPGDNRLFKNNCKVVPQHETTRNKKGAGTDNANSNIYRMHVSVMEVGQHIFVPKSNPSGRGLISPFVLISPEGVILENPKFNEIREEVTALIKR